MGLLLVGVDELVLLLGLLLSLYTVHLESDLRQHKAGQLGLCTRIQVL